MKMLRRGEYDLWSIRILGGDPNTGRTYAECAKEWNDERDRVVDEMLCLRWWQFLRYAQLRWQMFVLMERRGPLLED